MAVAPGSTSGTYDFALSNGSMVFEAFDRIGRRPAQVDRHMMFSARDSLNLLMIELTNAGAPLWEITSGTVSLVVGQANYDMPVNLVTVTEVWYSQPNGLGSGVNLDRIMTPITRTQYAALSNKLQQGVPTTFWYQMQAQPVLTIWEVPQSGAGSPTYNIQWYGLSRVQDADLGSGQNPNIVYRALDAVCAGLALRLAEKFAPARYAEKKAIYQEALYNMETRDQEKGNTQILPPIGLYARL